VVVGKGLEQGIIEIKDRRTGDRTEVPAAEAAARITAVVRG